jgi:hypothetical protein
MKAALIINRRADGSIRQDAQIHFLDDIAATGFVS